VTDESPVIVALDCDATEAIALASAPRGLGQWVRAGMPAHPPREGVGRGGPLRAGGAAPGRWDAVAPNGVSVLTYAWVFYQLPYGILAVALATADPSSVTLFPFDSISSCCRYAGRRSSRWS